MKEEIYTLAIESSCDDTSAAVLCNDLVLSNLTANQEIHAEFGGVVPELASRAHQKNIIPVVELALKKANISLSKIQLLAYTHGPGLLGSLLVGASFIKGLALSRQLPVVPVNHMHAHILAHFIANENKPKPQFPFLCLTVSGGHTQLVLVHDFHTFEVVGETRDDAAGEAFDKIAKIMGLPYPGGPLIDKESKNGNPNRFEFPVTRLDALDFSFSGLKTSVLYFLRKEKEKQVDFVENNLADICASVQETIVKMLLLKLREAIDKYQVKDIALAGGVSANTRLRDAFAALGKEKNCTTHIPAFEYCTDNAAMIGITAFLQQQKTATTSLHQAPKARLSL